MRCIVACLVANCVLFGSQWALAQEPVGVPDNIIKELKYLVGTWKIKGNIGDHEFESTTSYRWARNRDKKRYCLIATTLSKSDAANGTTAGADIIGWDAAKKQIVHHGFDSTGGCITLRWTVESTDKWTGELCIVDQGQEIKGSAEMIKRGPTECVYEAQTTTGVTARIVFDKLDRDAGPASLPRRRSSAVVFWAP